MATELKEIIMHLRKGVMFSVRISYRSARAHPYISGTLVFLLILSKGFPSLFALLISSSPVLVCTAILLGTLLSYGKPNIPEIEEEDKTEEISSLKVGSIVDDVVMKKDESFTVETRLEANMGVNERAVEDVLGEASNSRSIEIERDVPSVKAHDEGVRTDNTVLSTSLLLQKDDNTLHDGMKMTEERQAVEGGFVNKREFAAGDLAEIAQKFDTDHIVAITDQNELEGLTVQIDKTTSESPFDSSLGSPWHAVDTCDASSGSDSDGAESSSPDASMADIIPMLDELHPLLDSADRQLTLRTSDNSDVASSGSSEDHESDAGITEDEVENKEDADKESQEREEANEATVPWTADDQKNVMDLGYSEAERNRRLETLIARRRLRKLQRFETQKNLIDLDSLYPSSIPSISAPRVNPFDLPYDSYGNLNLPPIPGSAPSVLQPRQNPFDLPGDPVEELSTLSTEYLSHHDFVSGAQRGMSSRRHENSMVGPSFSGDLRKQLTLNQYFVSQRTDSGETGFTAFERQLTPKSDPKVCTIPGSGSSRYTGRQDYEELTEPEMHQESILLSHVDQDRRSVEAADSFDSKHERNRMDVDTDCAIDFNTSIENKETHQAANTFFGVMDKELGEVEDNLSVSDTGKLETIEVYGDSSSLSLEANEKISEVNIHGESSSLNHTRDEAMQSDRIDGAQSADIFPDSSSSAIIKTLSNIATPDEAFLYEGMENVIPTYLPADVQSESLGVASPSRPFEANLSLEDRNLVIAQSEEDLASDIGELLVESSNLSVVDENESRPRKIAEINEHDTVKVDISGTSGDVVHPTVSVLSESMAGQIVHTSSSSCMDSELSGDHSVTVDKSNLSQGNVMKELPSADEYVTRQSLEAVVPESLVSILNLPSNSEENFEDSHFEERRTLINSPESSGLTASQVAEEYIAHKSTAEEIGKDDFGIGLVPEGIKGDASAASPINPTHDGRFPGSHVLDMTENTEFSTLLEMKSENEMSSNNDSNDSQCNITDEILSKQEVRILKDLNNSDKESDGEVHAEVSGIKDIDEGLLSELDAVGDFRVEREPKWDQEGSGAELGQFDSVLEGSHSEIQEIPNQLQDMDDSVIPLGVITETKFSYSDKVIPDIHEPNSVKPQVFSSLLPSGEDPETTLYNSNLHVLEACPIEEIDSVFKKHHEEAVMYPALDSTVESSLTSTSEKGAGELDIATRNQEPSGSDAELLVIDAESVEDTSSALKQLIEGLDKPSISYAEMPDVLSERTHSEPEMNSDLHVVEARSLEDINVALKQLSEVSVESPSEQMELKDGHPEAETSERHVEPEVADVQSSEASEEHLQPKHVEVEPAEEIQINPVQTAAGLTNMQQSSEKSDGITADVDVSRPRDST